ncbi:MAG TPA: 4'-phosphopantetheinyl transferase superfamily protein [Thermopolyspora sp.]
MIEEILPRRVVAVDTFEDARGAVLFPEEEALMARAVDNRRRAFTTARVCARAALARLGHPPAPILRGERGAPIWPAGVVGSITHCHGYRAAAVAHATDVLTIGVDAEPNDVLPEGVLDIVADPDERAWIADLTATRPIVCWDRLLFSAKESVYKAWFPLTGRWLGFEEASLTADPDTRTFTARLHTSAVLDDGRHITGFTGRWLARDGLLTTAISVPADA